MFRFRRTVRRSVVLLSVGVVLLIGMSGCRFDHLAFRQDQRVDIVSPAEREEVALPVQVRWTVRDFTIVPPGEGRPTDDSGYFGVFIDRPPQQPGESLDWIARDDASCLRTSGCPDADYLAARGVHTTTETSFTIRTLVPPDDVNERREFHEVTIVLLNSDGVRIGESAFRVLFQVVRP